MDLSQGVPIQIHLTTFDTQGQHQETTVLHTPHSLVQMGLALYIRYQTVDEDADSRLPVTILLRTHGHIQLSRGSSNGDTQLLLFFADTKRVYTRYRTHYGIIPVTTDTPRIHVHYTTTPVAGTIYVQ